MPVLNYFKYKGLCEMSRSRDQSVLMSKLVLSSTTLGSKIFWLLRPCVASSTLNLLIIPPYVSLILQPEPRKNNIFQMVLGMVCV